MEVSCETCAHYLVLTEEDVERLGAVAKCAPPLRPQAEQDALWEHIAAGTLPIVTSDHSPAPPSMKESDDFFAIWGGIAGCQSTLPALLTGGLERDLPLPLLAALVAGNVARRFNLPQKGTLAVGADADLALVDLGRETTLAADDLLYRHRLSPYVGRRFRGSVVRTLLRGETVVREGRVVGAPRGRLLTPGQAIEQG